MSLLNQQRLYSDAQIEFAQSSPHLVWVTPPNRSMPLALRLQVFDLKGPRCAYCPEILTRENFTVDHIRPIARGGLTVLANLTVACRSCNSRKGATWAG